MAGPDADVPPLAAPVPEPEPRRTIREHYAQVVNALAAAVAKAALAAAGTPDADRELRRALPGIRARIEQHLAFERAVILPRVDAAETLGPGRVRRLHEEHDRLERLARFIDEQLEPDVNLIPVAFSLEEKLRAAHAAVEDSIAELLVPEVTNDQPTNADQLSS